MIDEIQELLVVRPSSLGSRHELELDPDWRCRSCWLQKTRKGGEGC